MLTLPNRRALLSRTGARLVFDLRGATALPAILTLSRAGNAMLYDSTGKLTYAPNNLYINSGNGSNTARTITTQAGVNYYIWVQTSTGTATVVASGTNTSTFNGSTSGTFTAFTATSGTLTLTPTSNFANITQVVVAAITYETALRSADNVVTGAAAFYGPRFWYDPATLAPWGLLFEPSSSTNLAQQWNAFTTSPWATPTADTVRTANARLSPDGTTNAWKISESNTTSSYGVYQPVSLAAGTYTIGLFVEAGERNFISLRANNGGTGGSWVAAVWNVSTGALVQTKTSGGWTYVGSDIVPVGGGRYLVILTLTSTASIGQIAANIYASNPTLNTGAGTYGDAAYAGASGNGAYVYGYQIVSGSLLGSPIPTAAATVTRAAETANAADYSTQPAIIQYRNVSDRTRARKALASFSSISSEGNIWIEQIAIYAPGTQSSVYNQFLTVDGPF